MANERRPDMAPYRTNRLKKAAGGPLIDDPEKPTQIKEVTKGKKRTYYNPQRDKSITSGNKAMDFLYNNQWLFNVPGVKPILKKKAETYMEASGGFPSLLPSVVENPKIDSLLGKSNPYTGGTFPYTGGTFSKINLVQKYLYPKRVNLPKSQYKPISDYFEFLPSYSIKEPFRELADYEMRWGEVPPEERIGEPPLFQDVAVGEMINEVLAGAKSAYHSPVSKLDSVYKQFLKNKNPLYKPSTTTGIDLEYLGVDLGSHKLGMAWDEEVELPYVSISDAWDFEPESYGSKWGPENERMKIQSTLLHRVGHPFKVYDRFYFDPKNKTYIPDKKINNMRKKPSNISKSKKPNIWNKSAFRKLAQMSAGMDSNTASDFAFPGSNLTKEQKMAISDKALPWIKDYLKKEYGVFSGAAKPDEILRRIYKRNPEMFNKKNREEFAIGGALPFLAPLISSAVGGLFGALNNNTDNRPTYDPVDRSLMDLETRSDPTSNIVPMEQGGRMTTFEGPSHEEGGIDYPAFNVEVEGGEVRTGNTIHSYDKTITKDMVYRYGKKYGGNVNITMKDVGKKIADVVKRKNKIFEQYEGDPWNDLSRIATNQPFEEMSNELAEETEPEKKCRGGKIRRKAQAGMSLDEPEKLEDHYQRTQDFYGPISGKLDELKIGLYNLGYSPLAAGVMQTQYDLESPDTSAVNKRGEVFNRNIPPYSKFKKEIDRFHKLVNKAKPGSIDYMLNMLDSGNMPRKPAEIKEFMDTTGYGLTDLPATNKLNRDYKRLKEMGYTLKGGGMLSPYKAAKILRYGRPRKAADGINLQKAPKMGMFTYGDEPDWGMLGPLSFQAFQTASNLFNRYETPRITPRRPYVQSVRPALIDPTQGIRQMRGEFRGGLEQMRKTDPRGWKRNVIQGLTQGEEAVSGRRERAEAFNVNSINRAREFNVSARNLADRDYRQDRMRADLYNAEAEAGDEASRRMAIESGMGSLAGTFAGRSRDIKAYESEARTMDMMKTHLEEMRELSRLGLGIDNKETEPLANKSTGSRFKYPELSGGIGGWRQSFNERDMLDFENPIYPDYFDTDISKYYRRPRKIWPGGYKYNQGIYGI